MTQHRIDGKLNPAACFSCHGRQNGELRLNYNGVLLEPVLQRNEPAGVADSDPSCTSCHSLPYDPATVTCGACHHIPPAGNQAPNIAGNHTIHTAFTGTTQASCDACHSGASACVGDHSNGTVSVSVLATYNAKGATALYNATGYSCSNISCHGGQTTPNWRTGSIDVNTQCLSCHTYGTSSPSPHYNSFYSGEHDKHVNGEHIACINCHDTTKRATVHFNNLCTTAMNQAAATLRNQIPCYSGGSCNPRCHGNENW